MSDDRRVLFQGELQLMRWAESSTNGASVTFWVHPDDLESFKLIKARAGKIAGQRIAAVMMEIGEDEAVVEQTPAPTATPAPRRYHPPTLGELARVAVVWCKNAHFQQWASEVASDAFLGECAEHELSMEQTAKAFILAECNVFARYGQEASRKHLDTDPDCAALFHAKIREPFRDHLKEKGIEL